jgi:ABC-type glycerol-3-phosphate transport system permease component
MIVTTSETWRPISYGLSKFVTEEGPRFNLQMAGSVIAIIPVLILYFITQKQFTEGIATTGLKG